MKKFSWLLIIILGMLGCVNKSNDSEVVATTSWTAAFVRLAGINDVELLAPYDMLHPSEYEITISDLERVDSAHWLVYAGYEIMMEEIRATLNIDTNRSIQIVTKNDPGTIRNSVTKLAIAFDTASEAEKNIQEVEAWFDSAIEKIKTEGLYQAQVIAHTFQIPFLNALGFDIIGEFGPLPLEVSDILKLHYTNAVMIIDNEHNPVGKALTEGLPDAEYKVLINFPGLHQTTNLTDVLDYNLQTILE